MDTRMPTIWTHDEPSGIHLLIYDSGPGWKIVVEKINEGKFHLLEDRWEMSIRDIPRYIDKYEVGNLIWNDKDTGHVVELNKFIKTHSD